MFVKISALFFFILEYNLFINLKSKKGLSAQNSKKIIAFVGF